MDRWRVTVWYRTGAGLIDVEHVIEELRDLDALIERGPSFYAIDQIVIVTVRQTGKTIEATLAE